MEYPCEIELTLREIIEINIACALVQKVETLDAKTTYDIARLSADSERILKELNKTEQSLYKKHKSNGKAESEFIEEYNKERDELLDNVKEKLRIPKMTLETFEAKKDYKLFDIKEGQSLVPIGFLKTMLKFINH